MRHAVDHIASAVENKGKIVGGNRKMGTGPA
jgi:hypothetical protein